MTYILLRKVPTTQEEAGTIIVHPLIASTPTKAIIVANDTNIFVLLLHFTFTGDIKLQVYMQPAEKESSAHVIDIAVTYQGYFKIKPNIIAVHRLSGWDTVCLLFCLKRKQL